MRNEIYTHKIGRPLRNQVLVEVEDIFNEAKTKAGVILYNSAHEEAWADSKEYKISNFFIRYGRVVSFPDKMIKDSFDFIPEIEIKKGDIVYWNIVSFQGSQPIVMDGRKFLLVHYKELLARIRGEEIKPINGNCLFTKVPEQHSFLEYTNVARDKTEVWVLAQKPDSLPQELNPRYHCDDVWEVGDKVYLKVWDKPFRLEGDLFKSLNEDLYAAPMRMILCQA